MGNLKELKIFLTFLAEKCNFNFDLNSFDHRLMLQKYVYIAKFFGWKHNYNYTLYIRGPYSRELADDYYKINETNIPQLPKISDNFEEEKFTYLTKNRNISWLEAGTTILLVHKSYKFSYEGKNLELQVKDTVQELKSSINQNTIENAFDDLKKYGLL
jgi:uncharacterized protein YwgA